MAPAMLGRGASRNRIDDAPTLRGFPLRFCDHWAEGRRLLAMNLDETQRAKHHINHNYEVRKMNKGYTSLIAVISFLAGPIACADAGEYAGDSRGRDSQALTASEPSRGAEDEVKLGNGTATIGSPSNTLAPGSGTLTLGETSAPPGSSGGSTVGPVRSSEIVVEEPGPSNPLVPEPTGSGGEIRLDGDANPSTITWGSQDAGVEIHLGVNPKQAC